jgi:hypothetical protein
VTDGRVVAATWDQLPPTAGVTRRPCASHVDFVPHTSRLPHTMTPSYASRLNTFARRRFTPTTYGADTARCRIVRNASTVGSCGSG